MLESTNDGGEPLYIAKEHVSVIIKTLADIKKTYEYNSSFIEEKEKETQDLLHEIELGKFDYKRGNKLARALKSVRQERRKAMDENAGLKLLYDYFEEKPIIKDLQRLQQDIAKEINKLSNRTYSPRVRDDLTIAKKRTSTSMETAFEKVNSSH